MNMDFQNRVLADLAQGDDRPIDVTAGGKLQHNQHRIGDMYRHSTCSLSRATILKRVMTILWRSQPSVASFASSAAVLTQGVWNARTTEPGETHFLHDADPGIQNLARGIVRGMMLPESGFANAESLRNFREAVAMNRTGDDVTFELLPHTSELDPVIVETIVESVMHEGGSAASDAAEYLEQNIVVVGHKVSLNTFRRTFAEAVRRLFIIAPKYRRGLNPHEDELVSAHGVVTGEVMQGIRAHAEHILTLCPEGGRMTSEGNIGVHKVGALSSGYHVPVMLDMPRNLGGIDADSAEALRPSQVLLYCGAPFRTAGSDTNRGKIRNYVEGLRGVLDAAHAPVGRYAWGIREIEKNQEGIDRSKGARETFRQMIPKTV